MHLCIKVVPDYGRRTPAEQVTRGGSSDDRWSPACPFYFGIVKATFRMVHRPQNWRKPASTISSGSQGLDGHLAGQATPACQGLTIADQMASMATYRRIRNAVGGFSRKWCAG